MLSPEALRRYSGSMRRPDIELSDEAARYVEQHADLIERLADQGFDAARIDRFRSYIRERRAAARTLEAEAGAQAFLARFARP